MLLKRKKVKYTQTQTPLTSRHFFSFSEVQESLTKAVYGACDSATATESSVSASRVQNQPFRPLTFLLKEASSIQAWQGSISAPCHSCLSHLPVCFHLMKIIRLNIITQLSTLPHRHIQTLSKHSFSLTRSRPDKWVVGERDLNGCPHSLPLFLFPQIWVLSSAATSPEHPHGLVFVLL